MTVVGIITPGAMGGSVGAAARSNGHDVIWASAGRSAETAGRAERGGLRDCGGHADLVAAADVILSVCPPHLAEALADEVAALGFGGLFVEGGIGAASALKMTFAAYKKGSTALLTAILAVAENLGVRGDLERQWGASFTGETHGRVAANTAKAWRFAGEMREISATFEDAGLPGGFHAAAAEVFERLATFKDAPTPAIDEALDALKP